MKQIATILALVISFSVSAQIKRKNYTVTLSIDEWNTVMQTMNNSREIMKKSTLPANVVNEWTDSLTNVQMKMSEQVQSQMRKDGTLPSAEEMEKHSVPIDQYKADSTKPKTPKK